ncbi:MAG: hypothetical protein RB292_00075 [Patescibacteria group bacterium]|jgi:hypothetical protein|nr:hypothetical protein [Patescibacteria group bacterium]
MSLNWKRIVLLALFIAFVIVIGYLLYFLFLEPSVPSQPTNANTNINTNTGGLPSTGTNVNIPTAGNINGGLPSTGNINSNIDIPGPIPPGTQTVSEVANGGVTKTTALTTGQTYQPALASDGSSVVYYDTNSGLFYRINPNGQTSALSDEIFFQVENITWSSDMNKAVLEYPDGSNIVYDFSTNQQVTLPQHWQDFSFSPNGQNLVFKSMGSSAESRWLAVASADGSRAQKIEHLGDKDSTVISSWSPNNQIIAMFREDKDFDRQNLYFVGLNGENFKSTIVEGRGFEGQWSTNGDKLLYSVYSSQTDYKPTLWIVDAQGNQIGQARSNLKLETWTDKCTFANNTTIYCAVPRSLETGAGIYKQDYDNSPTDIYKIDLTTGFSSKIATPQSNHNIESLIVTDNETYLYFQSKTDGKLYNIKLK